LLHRPKISEPPTPADDSQASDNFQIYDPGLKAVSPRTSSSRLFVARAGWPVSLGVSRHRNDRHVIGGGALDPGPSAEHDLGPRSVRPHIGKSGRRGWLRAGASAGAPQGRLMGRPAGTRKRDAGQGAVAGFAAAAAGADLVPAAVPAAGVRGQVLRTGHAGWAVTRRACDRWCSARAGAGGTPAPPRLDPAVGSRLPGRAGLRSGVPWGRPDHHAPRRRVAGRDGWRSTRRVSR
jgi:hypothetical protein